MGGRAGRVGFGGSLVVGSLVAVASVEVEGTMERELKLKGNQFAYFLFRFVVN